MLNEQLIAEYAQTVASDLSKMFFDCAKAGIRTKGVRVRFHFTKLLLAVKFNLRSNSNIAIIDIAGRDGQRYVMEFPDNDLDIIIDGFHFCRFTGIGGFGSHEVVKNYLLRAGIKRSNTLGEILAQLRARLSAGLIAEPACGAEIKNILRGLERR